MGHRFQVGQIAKGMELQEMIVKFYNQRFAKSVTVVLVALMSASCGLRNEAVHFLGSVSTMQNIAWSIESYYSHFGIYPGGSTLPVVLEELRSSGFAAPISKRPVDSWGEEIEYHRINDGYALRSCGPDRKCSPRENAEGSEEKTDDLIIKNGIWNAKEESFFCDLALENFDLKMRGDHLDLLLEVRVVQGGGPIRWSVELDSTVRLISRGGDLSSEDGIWRHVGDFSSNPGGGFLQHSFLLGNEEHGRFHAALYSGCIDSSLKNNFSWTEY